MRLPRDPNEGKVLRGLDGSDEGCDEGGYAVCVGICTINCSLETCLEITGVLLMSTPLPGWANTYNIMMRCTPTVTQQQSWVKLKIYGI